MEWKEKRERLERYDEKFSSLGHIQRIDRFATVHPIVYEEGIKRVLRESQLFAKAPEHHRNKLVALLWEVITVRNRVVPGKTKYLAIVVKELLDAEEQERERERRIVDCLLFICDQESTAMPPMSSMKSLASNLIRQVDLVKGKRQKSSERSPSPSMRGVSPGRNYQTQKCPSRTSKSPVQAQVRSSFTKKPAKQDILCQNKPRVTTPLKKSHSSFSNRTPLFQLEIKINSSNKNIEVYPNEDAAAVVERLKKKMTLSSLMIHELKDMIEEFIMEHE